MTRTTICSGDWQFTKQVWHGTFTATNSVTGESHDTGESHINDAYTFVDQLAPAAPKPEGVTYTIASGPQRARAGHQRRRAWDFA